MVRVSAIRALRLGFARWEREFQFSGWKSVTGMVGMAGELAPTMDTSPTRNPRAVKASDRVTRRTRCVNRSWACTTLLRLATSMMCCQILAVSAQSRKNEGIIAVTQKKSKGDALADIKAGSGSHGSVTCQD